MALGPSKYVPLKRKASSNYANPLGGQTGPSLPDLLSPESLMESVKFWGEQYYNQDPVLSFFDEKAVSSEEVLVETVIKLLKTGRMTVGPEAGQRADLARYAARLVRVLYQQYEFSAADNHAAMLRNPGSAKSMADQDILTQASEWLVENEKDHVDLYWRTLAKVVYAVMQGQTTVSGVDASNQTIEFDFGVEVQSASASWATSTTDVIGDFQRFINLFRLRNGGKAPSDIFVPFDFHSRYILANAELREGLGPYNAELMKNPRTALQIITEENVGPGTKIHFCARASEASGANEGLVTNHTQMWNPRYMTLALKEPTDTGGNFKLYTAKTKSNGMMGGIYSYSAELVNPMKDIVVIGGNHFPAVKNPNRVMPCDLTLA